MTLEKFKHPPHYNALTASEAHKHVHDIHNLIRLDDEAGAVCVLREIAEREYRRALKAIIDRFGEILMSLDTPRGQS